MAKLQTSPGNALSPSRLCPPHLRTSFPYRYRTLKIIASSSSLHASYAISVRRASALPAASFRFHLTMDTLAVRLTIPPVGFVGDFHSLVRAPCRAHKEKRRPGIDPERRDCVYRVGILSGFLCCDRLILSQEFKRLLHLHIFGRLTLWSNIVLFVLLRRFRARLLVV